MKETLIPAPGYVLILPEDIKEDTPIYAFKEKEDAYVRGKVLQVGKSFFQNDMEYKSPCEVGDSALYSYGGFEDITYSGEIIRVVKFAAIVAVFKKGKNESSSN